MKNLRVGVVGVGHIGKNHARLYAETEAVDFAAIYDTGEADGLCYIIMQYVEGTTLKELIGGRPLETAIALSIAIQIADALGKSGSYTEKPSRKTRGASQLLDFGRQLVLQVGHVERFNPC
jgi:serine/threonine protein kinase